MNSKTRPLLSSPATVAAAFALLGCSSGGLGENASVSGDAVGSGQTVSIISVSSGKVLDVAGASTANGAPVQQWAYAGQSNQAWQVKPQPGGRYVLVNTGSGKCLDLDGASGSDGARVQQWSCSGASNQRWDLRSQADGSYEIVSSSSGKCLDLSGASANNGARIQQWSCAGTENQHWRLAATAVAVVPTGLDPSLVAVPVRIVSAASGKALDVVGVSTLDGALLQQWSYGGGANQRWRIEPSAGGDYTLVSINSGKCLDEPGSLPDDGLRLQQYGCWGGANQNWTVTAVPGGGYTIRSSVTGKCVDVTAKSTADGAAIQQWGCWGGGNQTWLIDTVASGPPAPPPPPVASLREAAEAAGKWIGTAISPSHFVDARYTSAAGGEFDYVTPENEMKWDAVEPTAGQFSFNGGDQVVSFAEQHGMHVKGHTLVWHNQLPGWVGSLAGANAVRAALTTHISGVAGHFRGKVAAWDVVNEALDDSPSHAIRDDVFHRALGDGYIAEAFRIAHAADPGALLFYNDYGIEALGGKADAMYAMVQGLVAAGVPISGVGLQMHVGANAGPSAADIAANMHRLAALGLLVNVSELDVSVCGVNGSLGDKLAAQQTRMHDIVAACMSEPHCPSVTVWGVSDSYSWLNSFAPCGAGQTGSPWPLVFDDSSARKPAWQGIANAFAGK